MKINYSLRTISTVNPNSPSDCGTYSIKTNAQTKTGIYKRLLTTAEKEFLRIKNFREEYRDVKIALGESVDNTDIFSMTALIPDMRLRFECKQPFNEDFNEQNAVLKD